MLGQQLSDVFGSLPAPITAQAPHVKAPGFARLAPLSALALLLIAGRGNATELVWDGSYRMRARYFDSLSLSDTNDYAEGSSFGFDHRLRLQPGWLLSDRVAIYTQVDLLPFVSWGDTADTTEAFTGDELPIASSQSVGSPTTEEGAATLQNIRVTRAWAEADLGFGRLRFGRVPVQWGSGLVWNAGNDALSEYGDTADRIQLTSLVGPVYVIGAFDVPFEGYLNQRDDFSGLVAGVLYETETKALGTYNTFRWMNNTDDGTSYKAFIGDVWGWAQMGQAEVELELATVAAGGDLDTGENDIRVLSFGGNLGIKVPIEKIRLGVDVGYASGDKDETDSALHVFSFDPDFNRTLILFEEPLPTLEAGTANSSNGGRTYDAMRTGDGISNAVYLRPSVGYQLREDLSGHLSLFAAQKARVAEDLKSTRGYGLEVDADVYYAPVEFFNLHATGGFLLPGKYYTEFEDDKYGSGFDQPAFGLRLVGEAHF